MKKLLLFFSIFLSMAGMAQKLNHQLRFEKGTKLEMVTTVNAVVTQAMGDMKVNATVTRLFDVNDVLNNTAVIEHKVKRVQFSMENPVMGSQSFDSEKESDIKQDMGKAMEKALKNKYTMTVDATGKVVSVKQEEVDMKKKKSAE